MCYPEGELEYYPEAETVSKQSLAAQGLRDHIRLLQLKT